MLTIFLGSVIASLLAGAAIIGYQWWKIERNRIKARKHSHRRRSTHR